MSVWLAMVPGEGRYISASSCSLPLFEAAQFFRSTSGVNIYLAWKPFWKARRAATIWKFLSDQYGPGCLRQASKRVGWVFRGNAHCRQSSFIDFASGNGSQNRRWDVRL